MWTFDFGCMVLNFGFFDVGFLLNGRWILVVWTLYFGCIDVEFWLVGLWILVGMDVEFWL